MTNVLIINNFNQEICIIALLLYYNRILTYHPLPLVGVHISIHPVTVQLIVTWNHLLFYCPDLDKKVFYVSYI